MFVYLKILLSNLYTQHGLELNPKIESHARLSQPGTSVKFYFTF